MNYQNRLIILYSNNRDHFINIFLLLLIILFILKFIGGSPIIGIWESNYIFNNYAAQNNSFNIFSISPRANIGDYGYGTLALSRYFLELFNLKINLNSIRLVSIIYGYLSIVFFYLICSRYFNKSPALFSSILLIVNPVFHNYQYEFSNLCVSFMFFLFFFERLQKIQLDGIHHSSFLIIMPTIFIFIHYGIMRISAIAYFILFIIYFYLFLDKKKLIDYLFFFTFTFFISFLILIFFDKGNFFLLNSIDILFPQGSENILTDDITENKIDILKVLSINIEIYFETFLSIFSNNYVSNNINLLKADFRYMIINISIFLFFIFGVILNTYEIFKYKNFKNYKHINLIFLLIVCLIPSLFSSVYFENNNFVSTLSTHRLFLTLFPIYLFVCMSLNFLNQKIKNKNIYFFFIITLILVNLFLLIHQKNEMISKIEKSSNLDLGKDMQEIYGKYEDRDNYQHIKLQTEYINVAKDICKNNFFNDTIIKIDLEKFKSGIPNPRSLKNLKNFNYHNIFLSLYIYDVCKKNTAWINVYDEYEKKIVFNFTSNSYYFAELDYSMNEYKHDNLKYELKNYKKDSNNIVIVTTNKEMKFIEEYLLKLN